MIGPRRVGLMLSLEWPYKRHAAVFAGTQQYAQEQGWLSTVDEFAYDTLPARRTKTIPYDGIIARVGKKLAERADRLGVPVVNVWLSSPAWQTLPGVFPDYRAAARLCAEHLLSRGFRNFAWLGCRHDRSHKLEGEEFRRITREAGCQCEMAKVSLGFSDSLTQWRKSEQAISAWMDKWELPIGISCTVEVFGRMVVQMCRGRGWRVPEDVSIVAGRNEEAMCLHPRPSLTSVELGYERVGYEAARLLDRLMDERKKSKGKDAPPEHILLPPQSLVVRESTDFFAVDDDTIAAALEFIAAESHKPIGPENVARALAMEKRTLQRRFRKVLDRGVAEEIRRVRIERAKRELTQTEKSIAKISRDVGFGEPMRMYEIFRRELGVTPSEYRKERQPQEMI